MLVHEGDPRGARQVGRCVIPVGNWDGEIRTRPRGQESNVVAEGYFPVLAMNGTKYAGDLRVCLRACLGPSSKLRRVLEAAKAAVDQTSVGGETQELLRVLGEKEVADPGDRAAMVVRRFMHEAEPQGEHRTNCFRVGGPGGPLTRASLDSEDLSNTSSVIVEPSANQIPVESAPLSSFQLNEALAKFDVSNTLPVWPTPKGSLYHPPETHGEPPPTPRQLEGQARKGRLGATNARPSGGRKAPSIFTSQGKDPRSPGHSHAGVQNKQQAPNRTLLDPPQNRHVGEEETQALMVTTSVSPERQAPHANLDPNSFEQDRGRAENFEPPAGSSDSSHLDTAANSAVGGRDHDMYLAKLLNRGKELQEKMAQAAGNSHSTGVVTGDDLAIDELAPPLASSFPALGMKNLTEIPQPGLVSGARLGSALRNDIEGIFDTLSDTGTAGDEAGVSVRDPEARGHEDRVVNLLLAAAGPPPSSLAFPALAEVERRRADSLAQVRFLRIRLSRLVMFGSMTSAPEGHGWQLRFRLPAFTAPPGRSRRTRRTAGLPGTSNGCDNAGTTRVISLPVPARVPASSQGKRRTSGRGRVANAGARVGSMLRVRRGYGAADLVVGETSMLSEVVCAVNVNDACVRHWMDAGVEFLLVDGRTEGAPPVQQKKTQKQQQQKQLQQAHAALSSTVGPGDRVAAVATLPLRDLVLSAELGMATTLDLTEVVDFWAAEDARAAAAGLRGRGGRLVRNPYRGDAVTAARPLVLGDRAVGALAVALELVPGEVDVSPEHSRPEVERASGGRQNQGAERGKSKRDGPETTREGDALRDEEGEEGDETVPLSATARLTEKQQKSSSSLFNGDASPEVGVAEKRATFAGMEETTETAGEQEDKGSETNDWVRTASTQGALAPAGRAEEERRGTSLQQDATMGEAAATSQEGLAVMLRLKGLTLAETTGAEVEHVRVAYSFNQVRVERRT